MSDELSPAEFCYSGAASCRPSAAVRMMRLLIFLMTENTPCQLPNYLDMKDLQKMPDAQIRIENRIEHMIGNHRSALNSFSALGQKTKHSPSSEIFETYLYAKDDDKNHPQKIYAFICLFLKTLQQYSQNLQEEDQQQVTEKILRKMQKVFLPKSESQPLDDAYQSIPFSPQHHSAPSIPAVSLNAEQNVNPLCTANIQQLIEALLDSETLKPYQNDPDNRIVTTSQRDASNSQEGCCCILL